MLDFILNQMIALSIILSFWFTLKLFFDFKKHQSRSTHWRSSWLLPVLLIGSTSYVTAAFRRFDHLNQSSYAYAETHDESAEKNMTRTPTIPWIKLEMP